MWYADSLLRIAKHIISPFCVIVLPVAVTSVYYCYVLVKASETALKAHLLSKSANDSAYFYFTVCSLSAASVVKLMTIAYAYDFLSSLIENSCNMSDPNCSLGPQIWRSPVFVPVLDSVLVKISPPWGPLLGPVTLALNGPFFTSGSIADE